MKPTLLPLRYHKQGRGFKNTESHNHKKPNTTDLPNMNPTNMKYSILIALCALLPFSAFAESTPSPQPDELKGALSEMITSITKTVSDSKAFVVEQAPDYFKQVLEWEAMKSQAWAWVVGLGAGLIILLAIGVFRSDDDETAGFCLSALAVILLVICASNVMDAYKIKVAPKVFLVEYANQLTK